MSEYFKKLVEKNYNGKYMQSAAAPSDGKIQKLGNLGDESISPVSFSGDCVLGSCQQLYALTDSLSTKSVPYSFDNEKLFSFFKLF